MSDNKHMQINVECRIENLCAPVRNSLEQEGFSHLAVRNACNSHLGKMKSEKVGDDKRGDAKYNVKKDSFKVSVKPGRVEFISTANVVEQFIAWHDQVAKCHAIASMDYVAIPTVFTGWLQFAKAPAKDAKQEAKELAELSGE
jgi:hypothetical protein